MKRILLLIGALFFITGTAFGQTTLSAGDLFISAYNENGDDNFYFVLLTDIESGTEIIFTDNGWFPEAGSFRDNEGQVTWTATSALSKGTEISILDPGGSPTTNYGTVTESENGFTIAATSGDQIIAFQGTLASPTSFIYMFDSSTSGLETEDVDVTANEDSGLPTGLTEGTNAFVNGTATPDHFQYNCPTIVDATASNILASAMSGSNYTTNSGTTEYGAVGCNYRDATITGNAGWRLLSFPVSGGTIEGISDDTAIQGVSGGSDDAATTNFILYDHSDGSWDAPTHVSTAITNGIGFGVYFYDNTSNGSSELPVTLDLSGAEPSGDLDVTLNTTTTEGELDHYFTLVGNPFASNFDLNDMTANGVGILNNVHTWSDATGTYSEQDVTLSSFVISPWQGFWVESQNLTPSTTLTFPEAGKVTDAADGSFFSKASKKWADISFQLTSETTNDEALKLSFIEGATTEFDKADASKLVPLLSRYATMAFATNNTLKSVESLPYNLEEEIKLDLEEQLVGVSGEFTLNWKGLESIPSDWMLTFHDYKTGETVDMRTETEYNFDADAPATEKVNPLSILTGPVAMVQKSKSAGARFGITITPTTSVNTEPNGEPTRFTLEQNYPNPFNPSTTINYSIANSGQVQIAVYNLMGQKVAELVNETKSAGSYNVTWNASGAASGMYYYRLEANGQTMTRKMTLIK